MKKIFVTVAEFLENGFAIPNNHQLHCISDYSGYEQLIGKPCLKNLKVLLPMAEDEDFIGCELNVL